MLVGRRVGVDSRANMISERKEGKCMVTRIEVLSVSHVNLVYGCFSGGVALSGPFTAWPERSSEDTVTP